MDDQEPPFAPPFLRIGHPRARAQLVLLLLSLGQRLGLSCPDLSRDQELLGRVLDQKGESGASRLMAELRLAPTLALVIGTEASTLAVALAPLSASLLFPFCGEVGCVSQWRNRTDGNARGIDTVPPDDATMIGVSCAASQDGLERNTNPSLQIGLGHLWTEPV